MIPFITEHTDSAQVIQFGQNQIMQSLATVNANVTNSAECVTHQLQTMEKKLKNAEKKKRRSCVSENLALQNNGKIMLMENYDDETQGVKEFAYNLKGEWSVARIEFRQVDIKESKYIILFPDANLWVVGDVKKNSGKNLYEAFVKAGVNFAPDNSVSKIQRILFSTFGAEIDRTQAVYYFPELAGWNSGQFLYAENCNYEKRLDFPDLPVMQKHFKVQRGNRQQLEIYLSLYKNVTCWQERILLLEMPILGILSSVYAEERRKLKCFLNLVFCENITKDELIYLLQIFNRERLRSIDAEDNSSNLRNILMKTNDEILIVDATGGGSSYIKRKQQDNVKKIATKICQTGNSVFSIQRDVNAVLVVFNDAVSVLSNAVNLMVSKELFRATESIRNRGDKTGVFLTEFLMFAERRLEEIRSIIKNSCPTTEGILFSGWRIIELFCHTVGIDLYRTADLPIYVNFEEILQKFNVPEDIEETFIKIIRRELVHWEIIEKRKMQKFVFAACYHDEKFLWIPTKIFDRMLAREGMLPYKLNFLYEMKKRGNLLTDSTGLSSRVQIAGRRIEAYKFRRACFSIVGEADVIDLGKEMTAHVDG